MTFLKDTIRAQVYNRIPQIVRSDFPAFAQFILDYYEWMEQDDNFYRVLIDMKKNMEPTNFVRPFVDSILKDAGFDIELEGDQTILDDEEREKDLTRKKSNLLHILREFYLARGSKQSFDFIFNTVFKQKADIVYPRERMLVTSTANYGTIEKIFTAAASNLTIDGKRKLDRMLENSKTTSGTVKGVLSGAIATIEKMTRILSDGLVFLEIEILEPNKEFFADESVEIKVGDDFIFEEIENIADFVITNGGYDYQVGDVITVSSASIVGAAYVRSTTKGPVESLVIDSAGVDYEVGDLILTEPQKDGSGFSAIVSEVDVGGEILAVKIISGGYGYKRIPKLVINSLNGSGADILAVSSQIGSIKAINHSAPYARLSAGYTAAVQSSSGSGADIDIELKTRFSKTSWQDRLGFLGERCHLIDSNKYQQFSYEIVSPVDPQRYQTIVDDLLHPVGYIKSSVIEIQSHIDIGILE